MIDKSRYFSKNAKIGSITPLDKKIKQIQNLKLPTPQNLE